MVGSAAAWILGLLEPTAGAQNLRPYVKTHSPAPPFMGKVKQRDFS